MLLKLPYRFSRVQRCLRAVLYVLYDVVQRVFYVQRPCRFVRTRQLEVMFGEAARQRVGRFTHEGVGEAVAAGLRTLRDGEVVGLVPARAEQLFPRIVRSRQVGAHLAVPVQHVAAVVLRTERHGRIIQTSVAFAVHGALVETARLFFVIAVFRVVTSRAVYGLHFRQIGGQVGGDLRGEVHRQFAAFGALAGDNHRAVCRFRTVKCRGRSAFQHTYAFNIFGVDVHQTVGTYLPVVAEFGKVGTLARSAVADGHAVQDDERLVVSGDGRESAYIDRHGSGGTALRLRDADARRLTVHGGCKVGCSRLHYLVRFDSAHRVTQPFGILLDTHSRDDHLFQLLRVLSQRYPQVALLLAFCQMYFAGGIAHIGYGQRCIGRHGQCKVSVHIGNDTVVGSFLYDAGADKRLSRHIPYHTFDCFGFLRTGTSCKQKRQCHNHTT